MLKVAFLWHMHQPYYRDPVSGKMFLPWVRLHCLKDYLDMPIRISRHDRLKMTFNLVPSLIEQIDLYCRGETSDRHFDLTRKPAADLTREEKAEIFRTFFWVNPQTMIQPFPVYRRFYKKLMDCGQDPELAARMSTVQEIRDLTVWANLVWVDPVFRRQSPFRELLAKGEKFTEEEKQDLIAAQLALMAEIIPTYRSLMAAGKIEVSFTPYFHPILPLLCDIDSAREALPGITLPKHRFAFPEDAEKQVAMACEMYRRLFACEPAGMWPSEGSISESALDILAAQGLNWAASDEQVLSLSAQKSGLDPATSPFAIYTHPTPHGPINLFFRDHNLSDKIGFIYSGWDAGRAVNDFIGDLHKIALRLGADAERAIVPIILDGENCWEYYPNDGDEFLNLLFERLATDSQIETVTMAEACRLAGKLPLPRITAGSWINHNFRVWIGHPEDNAAWDMLYEARQTLKKAESGPSGLAPEQLEAARKAILIAEGSDWNWWYGDEHRGGQNEIFDQIFRAHIMEVYHCLGRECPAAVHVPIMSAAPGTAIIEPEGSLTPTLDGRLTHYYEWLGAGLYDCRKAGGAMHRGEWHIATIHFASDDQMVYFRVDFMLRGFLVDNPDHVLNVNFIGPCQGEFSFSAAGILAVPEWASGDMNCSFACADLAEVGIRRTAIFPDGKGEVLFKISISFGDREMEIWPQGDPIRFQLGGQEERVVWDL